MSERPKGYAPWNPSPEVQVVLDQVNAILVEYRDYLPLTNRQIFYRLVGAYGFDKTERAYKRLCNYLTRARRAQLVKFSAIRDDKVSQGIFGGGFSGPEEFRESVREAADDYARDRMEGQEVRIELWCEAEGMLPQMDRVARPYGIPTYSAGGFLSVTATHDLGTRAARAYRQSGLYTVVLHVGDYDPSGESIFNTIAADSGLFAAQYTGDRVLQPKRVALTAEQVAKHGLPTAPPKSTDSRSAAWYDQTAQAEAMPPDLLAQTVRDALESHIDLDVRADVIAREDEERERIREWLEELS